MTGQNPGFTIKLVAERTGVSVHTLRAWERRYGIPKPSRGAGNRYRVYDEQDIAEVLWLKHQIESGITPALAAALRRQERNLPTAAPESGPRLAELRSALVASLAASDASGARVAFDQIVALFTPEQVALEIVEPVMQELGTLWERDELDVWQEHLASNLIRQRIVSLILAQPAGGRAAQSLVAACAPEELHELGLLLFALLARRQGWQVGYLGQRTPLANVLSLASEYRWVALSVSTPLGLASLVPLFGQADLPRARLLFGGSLLNQVPVLQEHLPGVFVGRNAQEAVQTLSTRVPARITWGPAPKQLRAGLTLQSERLKLGWQVARQLQPARPRGISVRPAIDTQALAAPTLFLVDALSSALAFGAPELMDAQGAWLAKMLPPRDLGAPLLKQFLAAFGQIVEQGSEQDTARQVMPLLERLQHSSNISG